MKKRLSALALGLVALMAAGAATAPPASSTIPPAEGQAKDRLNKSLLHGEFVDVQVPGREKLMKSYIVYPQRADKAPVVVVIMEIFGMTDWVRATTDQLAADGFIAIAPDFLSGKGPNGGDVPLDTARGMVSGLRDPEVMPELNAAREYAIKQPSANGKSAVIGFCWGGGKSFAYAAAQPELNAAVVFYGTPPSEELMAKIKCPVAGFYGGMDNRITATVPDTTAKMKKLGKTYESHVFEGAGHGFMRAQDAPGAIGVANAKAAKEAWPRVVEFLKENTK
jgi:carboxymethylenebutenolidase